MGKIKLSIEEKIIVIVGLPASGKSFLANEVLEQYEKRNYKMFRTDDYIKYGFEESLYKLMDDLRRDLSPRKIIEGVQGYRLLRKGLQLGTFNPDVVIVVAASSEQRHERFKKRPDKKLNRGFDATLEKIWADYLELLKHMQGADRDFTQVGDGREFVPPRFLIYNSEGGNNKNA